MILMIQPLFGYEELSGKEGSFRPDDENNEFYYFLTFNSATPQVVAIEYNQEAKASGFRTDI